MFLQIKIYIYYIFLITNTFTNYNFGLLNDKGFIESIFEYPVNLDNCNSKEIFFLTLTAAIIDYFFQINEIDIPEWIRDERLVFQEPYYYSKRLTDFEKIKLQFSNPAPFRRRNVYFELEGLQRI